MTVAIALDHLPVPGGKWVCGCDFDAHVTAFEADDCRLKEFRRRFVVEHLALGFFCPKCGTFTGDAKEFQTVCRGCQASRPRVQR